eukprot:1178502-Prorocentrum_minimum.AAC.4
MHTTPRRFVTGVMCRSKQKRDQPPPFLVSSRSCATGQGTPCEFCPGKRRRHLYKSAPTTRRSREGIHCYPVECG